MNKVILIGRITKDIELRYTQSNMAIASFNVAVQRNYKNAKGEYDADFISCKAFDKRAEVIEKHFNKGSQIGIEGHLQTGSYEKEDGTKVYTTDVIVDGIDFIGNKAVSEETKAKEEEKEEKDPFKDFSNEVTLSDDDLPW